jgi:hypothetical protein
MNGNKAPHPIIFNFSPTNNHNQPGEHLTFELTLIDQSARYLPYLIQAWQYAGERGVGKENARFHLAAIDAPPFAGSDQWQPLYTRATQQIAGLNPQPTQPPPYTSNPIDITFTSPFRTKVRGKLIGPGEFSPTHWIRPLLNRIEHLRLIHSPQTSSSLDVAALITATHNLRITRKQLRWHDWTRHSSRQRSQMQMGGLVGGFTLVGEPLETLWPLLWLGQWLHAGKGTSFGLGGYRLAEQTGQQ